MGRVPRVLLGFLALLLVSTSAWAQATAQINGSVADSSGAVLPGVTIVAIQTDTGFRREGVTNDTGSYALLNLPIGPYRLEASLAGFRSYAQTGIVLQVGSNPVIKLTLQLGESSGDADCSGSGAARRDPQSRRRQRHHQRTGRGAPDGRAERRVAGRDRGRGRGYRQPVEPQPDVDARDCHRRRFSVRRRIPARRRAAQQRVRRRQPAAAVPGRDAGVQGRDQLAERAERLQGRRDGERRDQVGHQRLPRRRVRIRTPPSFQRDEPVCRDQQDHRQALRRWSGPQPVRRRARRAARARTGSSSSARTRARARPRRRPTSSRSSRRRRCSTAISRPSRRHSAAPRATWCCLQRSAS